MQQNIYGNNIIITEPSSNLRALGRNALAGKWQTAIIAVAVYTLCIQVPPAILDSLFGINIGDWYVSSYYSGYYMGVDTYSDVYNSLPTYSPLSGIYTLLVSGPLQLGVTLFFLAMFRKQAVGVSDIFLGFERFGKALGLMVFQGIFIFLWSLLFVVPGIIAAIRYSQAFYILADDPNKDIRQCMDESKMMMKGNKAKYFCMTLSFIGWLILASIPESILFSISTFLQTGWLTTSIITIIGTLFVVPVVVYMSSTQAGFYEILAGHLIKETEPAPVAPEAVPVSSQSFENEAPFHGEAEKRESENVNDDTVRREVQAARESGENRYESGGQKEKSSGIDVKSQMSGGDNTDEPNNGEDENK